MTHEEEKEWAEAHSWSNQGNVPKEVSGSYVIDTKMSKEEWDAMAPEFKLTWLKYLEENDKHIGVI